MYIFVKGFAVASLASVATGLFLLIAFWWMILSSILGFNDPALACSGSGGDWSVEAETCYDGYRGWQENFFGIRTTVKE